MGRKAGRPRLDKQSMAKMLVEAAVLGDRGAASKYEVSLSTLQRYRKLIQDDPDFGSLFVNTAAPVLTRPWADDLDNALRRTVKKMVSMVESQPDGPEGLEAVTKAFSAMAELQLAKEILSDDIPDDQSARAFEEAQAGLSASSLN